MIASGELDHLPEQAFYMVGTIDEAIEKSEENGSIIILSPESNSRAVTPPS